jgi:amidase
MKDIAFAPATKLAAMIRSKKIGCLELLEHYLARVEKYNSVLNAIVAEDISTAKKRARAADRAVARGDKLGPFHGVPMTVKDAFDVKGLPTTWGLPELKDNKAQSNALAVDRWLAAGANVFGKTNVPPWPADSQTANPIYGITRNPWDTRRTPGGSSGGSAAVVAAGLAGIEIGSDIASSIRNPAIYCGIYGHKPTYGICPPRGHTERDRITPDDISVVGPLARSAVDLAPALGVMAGPDEIDSAGYRLELKKPDKKALKEFRIAVLYDDPTSEIGQEIQDTLHAVTDFLVKSKVKVRENARPALNMHRVHEVYNLMLRAASAYRQTDEQFAQNAEAARKLDPRDESFKARALRAAAMSHREWLVLEEERNRLRWVWHEFFKDYDLLLCPLVPFAAPIHDPTPALDRLFSINGKQIPFTTTLFWAGLTGLTYLPATGIPTGLSKEGMPIGIQIVGPQFGDLACIEFAKLMEKQYRGYVPPPGYE